MEVRMGRKALCWMAVPWGRSGQCNQEQQRVLVLLILPWSWQTPLAPCVSLGFYFILFGPKILIRMAVGPHGVTLVGGRCVQVMLAPASLTRAAVGTMDVP